MPFNRFPRILQESPQTGVTAKCIFASTFARGVPGLSQGDVLKFFTCKGTAHSFWAAMLHVLFGLAYPLPSFQIHLYTWGLFKEANSLQKHRIFWTETTKILYGVCSVIIYCNLFWNRSKTGSAWNLHVRCSCLSWNIKLCYVRVNLLDCRIYFPYFSFSYATKIL